MSGKWDRFVEAVVFLVLTTAFLSCVGTCCTVSVLFSYGVYQWLTK